MEPKLATAVHSPGVLHRLLPVVGPALLISVGYVDPGKWAATIEGGARFGYALIAPMLIFNLAAIFCQYLSARVGVVTGKDLAKICSAEYDTYTCMLLGIQSIVSVIALDLSMILGIAHGLNLIFGLELSTCVLTTAVDAVLFPFFAAFLERHKANLLCMCVAGLILLFYFFGILFSQPEMPFSFGGLPPKFEESAYALMSLLGASIVPHNLFLHSSIALQQRGQPNASIDAFCQYHLFAIVFIFSGIYVVNHILMSSAANVFYSTGLVLLTFPDATSLMEQVFRTSAFLLIVYFANQIMGLTWNHGGHIVMHDFLQLDLPNWLQRATIRIIAIIPALYCVWTSGVEGVYQLLIFTQVILALLLPSSVIPLFRVASSSPIMGVHKISQFSEFLALMTCMGMLGIKTIFVVEMIFGDSDWVSNLRWNMGSSSSVPYIVLLVTSCLSSCLMLWLAATPLKSATRLGAQMLNWDVQNAIAKLDAHGEENLLAEEKPVQKHGEMSEREDFSDTISNAPVTSAADYGLPGTIMELDHELELTTIEKNCSQGVFPSPSPCLKEESSSNNRSVSISDAHFDSADSSLTDSKTIRDETVESVGKTISLEGDSHNERKEDDGDTWEPEESRGVPGSTSSVISDGPASFRSLSGKSEEGGNGTGSLSRLAGLGRAARRQLAAILDELWGQLYDFHGQPTQEAKVKKLDILVDPKLASPLLKVETSSKEYNEYYPSISSRGPDSLINSGFCDFSKQPRVQSTVDSSCGVQRGSPSLRSNHVQLLDAYVQGSNRNVVDSSERQYSSLRSLPTSDAWDNQPATVHGYQIASLVNRIAKDRAFNNLNVQMDLPTSLSLSTGPRNYRDPMAIAMAQKLQNGLSSPQAPRYQSLAVSSISSLQSEKSYQDGFSSFSSGSVDGTVMSNNEKKYHSLPDISGISGSYRNLYASEISNQWDKPMGFGPTNTKSNYESSFYSNTGSRSGAPLNFDELSKGYGGTTFRVTSNHGSLWSKQPYEQFGVADKSRAVGSGLGSRSSSNTQEAVSHVDSESQLLQSFRCCILKLLKLEGADWLFRQNDGADEDLIDCVAAREKCLYEAETREMTKAANLGEPQYAYSDRRSGSTPKKDDIASFLVSSVPHCGDGCVYKADLIISFGVWCIHRILDLSLMESRPELWGKYTYVLNRLQGIIDPAFSMPRTPMSPCFCLQLSAAQLQRSSPPVSNEMLPPTSKPGRGKCTTAAMLLDLIKDVEIAISCRKGRSGTAAGDVAFPKGKENLASVLKRYKRRLTNKPVGSK